MFTKPETGILHVIISPDDAGKPASSLRQFLEQTIQGGATTIQYRRKGISTRQALEEGRELREICRQQGVTFIVNDRVDIAIALEADGVHLGAEDLPVPIAREILGPEYLIGKTVRSNEARRTAEQEGADYVGCGPVFATRTKELAIEPLGSSGLHEVMEGRRIPVIAIGGITTDRLSELSPIDGVAVVGSIASSDDPESATRELIERVRTALSGS